MRETTEIDADVAVLIDPATRSGGASIDWDALHLPVAEIGALEEGRANRAAENLAGTIVLDGDDRLAARALTVYQRRQSVRERPVRFVPLQTGRFQRLAKSLGGPAPRKRLARLLAEEGVPEHWSEQRRRSLRVTTSARAAPLWGFNFGMGVVFDLFETLARTEGGGFSGWSSMGSKLVRQLASAETGRLEPEGARLSVDYEPRDEALGYLVASGLERTWMGISAAQGRAPGWSGGRATRSFLREVAGSAAVPRFLRGGGGDTFERIHVDGPGGFVLDGELYDPAEPHVVQVAVGPTVRFIVP